MPKATLGLPGKSRSFIVAASSIIHFFELQSELFRRQVTSALDAKALVRYLGTTGKINIH
jgi:hypothetical protein